MATMTMAVHSKRLLSPEWRSEGDDGEPGKIHITRLSAYDDQAGNLKSVVLRLYNTEHVRSLSVGGVGELTAYVKLPGEDSEAMAIPYGRLKVSANFISHSSVTSAVEWLVAFKPVKD